MTEEAEGTGKSQGITEKVGYKNPPKSGQLKKGYDPRRNTRGTPKDAITARKFIKQIGQELIAFKDESGEGDITRLYLLIRAMYASRNPRHAEILLKAQFPGLLKEEVDVTSGGEKVKGYVIVSPDDWDKDENDK
jgi:hypothetical protein